MIRKVGFLLFVGFCLLAGLGAQEIPDQLRFNEDTSMLSYGGLPSTGFYDEAKIKKLYLEFKDEDYWQQMLDNYDTEKHVLALLRFEDEAYDSIAVQFKGQTSFRKAVEEGSEKLSFSIKLDEYIDGQDIEGYNNFNLNNAYQDFSFMREVLYGSLSREFLPALKGNFIRLYLNGEDWGLYTNIQQLNGDYIKEWFFDKDGIRWRADVPAAASADTSADPSIAKGTEEPPGGGGAQWGDGTAALNYLGDSLALYQQYYTLKDTDMENPWDYLLQVCDVLNNTDPALVYDSLRRIMDIDATLWFLAREIAFADDDSYIHKGKMDYYLYVNEETGLMTPLEFDGNSAMSPRNQNWSPFINEEDENYPLLNILLSLPELRQRYIAHMKTLLKYALDPLMAKNQIDQYASLIAPELMTDPMIDFSMSEHNISVNRLKSFFNNRSNIILSNAEFQNEAPEISEVKQWQDEEETKAPRSHEGVEITARASHPDGLQELRLYYCRQLTGEFELLRMQEEEGLYSATIPGLPGGTFVRYYLEAVAGDSSMTVSYLPGKAEYEVFVYQVAHPLSENSGIVINELMASNNTGMQDEAGEFDDWIELHNLSTGPLSLRGYHLSDNASKLFKWMLPDTSISAGGYIIVWADEDQEQGKMHSSFKLSAGGEEVILTDADSAIVDQVVFSDQEVDLSFGRWPNARGSFVEMPASFQAENWLTVTSVQEEFSNSAFEIYPNPAENILYLRCPIEEREDIELFNSKGSLIYREKFSEEIDLSLLSPGLYILKNGPEIRKLLIR